VRRVGSPLRLENVVQSVRRLGILGGLSWASSLKYYELINLEILKLTGGTRSGDIVMWSFDYTHFPPLLAAGDWKSIAHLLQDAADKLVACGVEGMMIASNTIHEMLDQHELNIPVDFLDIRDSLLAELRGRDIKRIGLLGTSSTMGGEVYRKLISGAEGIEALLPPEKLWGDVDDMIFNGLCQGEDRPGDRKLARQIFDFFEQKDMRHVVLACTELGLLHVKRPGLTLLDTTEIHARDVARWSALPVMAEAQQVRAASASGRRP
jgi:aspartate racemase